MLVHWLRSANVTLVSLLQPENAEYPMLVTEDGIVMLVSLLQKENALSPMYVTLDGIVMLVSPLQYANARSPMLVTEDGIVHFVFPPGQEINVVLSLLYSTPWASLLYAGFSASAVMLVSPLQPENAEYPMLVTEDGIVMLVSPLHHSNAYSPMHVTG